MIANAFTKPNEMPIAVLVGALGLEGFNGTVVIIANAPEGQVVHYLLGRFGQDYGGRQYPVSHDPRQREPDHPGVPRRQDLCGLVLQPRGRHLDAGLEGDPPAAAPRPRRRQPRRRGSERHHGLLRRLSDPMRATSEELLELVSRSPAAVAIHDKKAWLDLFSRAAVVQDPVGTAPHRRTVSGEGAAPGDDPLDRFWETFIAPNRISFTAYQDIVIGDEVVRDVLIRSELGSGLSIEVPAYLVYRTTEENGEARIEALMAHWELRSMVRQVIAGGLAGLSTMVQLGWRMLKIQGAAGVLGYLQGALPRDLRPRTAGRPRLRRYAERQGRKGPGGPARWRGDTDRIPGRRR